MTARIRFEDWTGKALGYVDYKGKKLHPSKGMEALTEDWTPQEFMTYYSDSSHSNGHLNFALIDSSDDDESEYPKTKEDWPDQL